MSDKKKTIVRQVLITTYSDGSVRVTEMKVGKRTQPKRDAHGRFEGPSAVSATPDPMITCPYCGKSFRVGKKGN